MMSHRRGEADSGFTLIEALVVLSIAAAAIALAPLAISMGQASLRVAADVERHTSAHRVLAALSDRISAARPIFETGANGLAVLAFEGTSDRLRFVTEFADGPAGGGLYTVELALEPSTSRVVLRLQPFSREADRSQPPVTVAMLPAQGLVMRYFGTKLRTDAPEWREDWSNATQLPDLLSVEFMPAPPDAPLPAVIIGLRFAQ